VSKLHWNEKKSIATFADKIDITAFCVKHWGARKRRDRYRGYNGYVLERKNRRIIFSGDTAPSHSFAQLRAFGAIDGDHADWRLQSLDSFPLYSGTSRANG
jgi:L-ascorbate metabolism protein UlaG (beta-lactamase superfamily)